MVNAIMAGINNALHNEFGYGSYTEGVEHGTERPYFLVNAINQMVQEYPCRRSKIKNSFFIQYFPIPEGRAAEECHNVAERMMLCLKMVDVSGQILHGYGMNYRVTGGVLGYYVNYNFFTRRDKTVTYMESMDYQIEGKAGNKIGR